MIELGKLDDAIAIADHLTTQFPDHPDGRELRARIFEAQGNASKAEAELRKLRALLAFLDAGDDFDSEFHQWLDTEIERLSALTPDAARDNPSPR